MPDPSRHVYWDACVFLEFINKDSKEHGQTLETLLDEADKGQVEIFTSRISVVEVAFAASEKQGKTLDAAVEKDISRLFSPESSPVKIVEVHSLVADGARKLIRAAVVKGWSLKPIDAIHLSTAQRHGVDEFHTYDLTSLKKYESEIGIKVCEPSTAQQRLGLP